MARRPRGGPLAACCLLAASAWAQDDAPQLAGPALLARLKSPQLTVAEARQLAPQLEPQPLSTRLAGCTALREAYLAHHKQHQRAIGETQKLLAGLVAPPATRGGRNVVDPVELLRRQALAVSFRDGLTKAAIHDEIDPRVAELTEKLWPARDTLLAANPPLATALTALRQEREALRDWHAAYVAGATGLDLHPDAAKYFAKTPPPPAPAPATGLDDEWTVWQLLAMPLSARDRKTLEANETLRAGSDAEEFAGTTELNRLRWLLGLPLLRIDDKLVAAARDHSQDMVALGFFAHASPVAGKKTPGDRAARFGTSAGAENIAQGHGTGPDAIRGWWYSPGHHRNMLGGHARVGLGRSAQTWTQMFGG